MTTLSKQAEIPMDIAAPGGPLYMLLSLLFGGKRLLVPPGSDLTTYLQQLAQTQAVQGTLQEAVKNKQDPYEAIAKGVMLTMGIPESPDMQATASNAANVLRTIEGFARPMAPGLFEAMHGVKGSPQPFANALSELYRYHENLPPQAQFSQALASAAHDTHSRFFGGVDPMDIRKTYGMDPSDLSGSLSEMAKRGIIAIPTFQELQKQPGAIADRMEPWLKPIAIAKHILGQQGVQADPGTVFEFIDRTGLSPQLLGPEELGRQLGANFAIQQQGGLFKATADRVGLGASKDLASLGVSMSDLSKMHEELAQRGRGSSLGSMVGAARSMAAELRDRVRAGQMTQQQFEQSPVQQWLSAAQTGQLNPFVTTGDIAQLGRMSGFSAPQVMSHLRNREQNQKLLGVRDLLGIRMAQAHEADYRINQMARTYARGRSISAGDLDAARRTWEGLAGYRRGTSKYLLDKNFLVKMPSVVDESSRMSDRILGGTGWVPGTAASRAFTYFDSAGQGQAKPGVVEAVKASLVPSVPAEAAKPYYQFPELPMPTKSDAATAAMSTPPVKPVSVVPMPKSTGASWWKSTIGRPSGKA
jgi:hypothetical protein